MDLAECSCLFSPEYWHFMNYVTIIEPSPFVRNGIKVCIRSNAMCQLHSEYESSLVAIEAFRECNSLPTHVILGGDLPGRCSLDVISEINNEWPDMTIIALTRAGWNLSPLRFLRAGAEALVALDGKEADISSALDMTNQGKRFVSSTLVSEVFASANSDSLEPAHRALSERELEVLIHLVDGKSVPEIARSLYISPGTVSTYKRRIRNKLGLTNDAQVVRYAMEWGLYKLSSAS